MARRPKSEGKARAPVSGKGRGSAGTEALAAQEIDRLIERLDAGIAEEKRAMNALLSRLRTTRIAT